MTIRTLLLAAGLLAAAAPASAAPCEVGAWCKCIMRPTAEVFDAADAVFRGTVVSSRDVDGDDRRLHTIRVERAWKGDVGADVVVAEPLHGTSCAMFLQEGTSYLFTAKRGENGRLRVSPCERIGDEAEDSLGAPRWTRTGSAVPASTAERVDRAALRREVLRRVRALLAPRAFAAVRLESDGGDAAAAADEIAATLLLDPRLYVLRPRPGAADAVLPDPAGWHAPGLDALASPVATLRVTNGAGVVRVEASRTGPAGTAFAVESAAR